MLRTLTFRTKLLASYVGLVLAVVAIVAAVAQPSWRRMGFAAALCLVAPFVRGQLGVLLIVLAAGLFSLLWRTERFRAWRRSWRSTTSGTSSSA